MPYPKELRLEAAGNIKLVEQVAACKATGDMENYYRALATLGGIRAATGWTDAELAEIYVDELVGIFAMIEAANKKERDDAVPPTSSGSSGAGPSPAAE